MHKQPPYLQSGDTVTIVSPAGYMGEHGVHLAQKTFEEWGLKVKLGKNVFSRHGIFAGTDSQRAEDFQDAINDPESKAIICSRGGYGCARIVDAIDFSPLKENPKWVLGFSDITVFHSAIANVGVQSCHAPMPINYQKLGFMALKSLHRFLFGINLDYETIRSDYNQMGEIRGQVVGGNLAIIASLLGTPYQLYVKDRILFIEEVGEALYRVDRMLQSLRLAGYFEQIKGIVVGSFTEMSDSKRPFGKRLEEIILQYISHRNIPVCFGFPAGHMDDNHPLPFNKDVFLKVTDRGGKVVIR